MAETKTVQERLVEAFSNRPHGMLQDDGMLACLAIILREAYGFTGRLHYLSDLKALSDEHAEIALRHLPEMDIPRDPDLALRLLANEVARRGPRT